MRPNSEAGAPSAENVYDEIYSYVSEWSISPTIREIAGRLNCGHSTVQKRMLELASSGSIVVYGKRSRGIVLRKRP